MPSNSLEPQAVVPGSEVFDVYTVKIVQPLAPATASFDYNSNSVIIVSSPETTTTLTYSEVKEITIR